MPKKVTAEKTIPFTVRLSPDVVEMMKSLAGGLYGNSRAEVARSLIHDSLKTIFPKGKIE